MQYSNIELGHNMAMIQTNIAGQMRTLSRSVEKLMDKKQQELI